MIIYLEFAVKLWYNYIMVTIKFPLRTFNCFWRETSKDIIEKEVLTMSEKAQEVRRRRIESMECLRKSAEIAFDFILNELDEKTFRKDYSLVELHMFDGGTPYIGSGNNCKICDNVEIGFKHHSLFLKIIADMFNAEEGYSAKIENESILKLIVNIDVV